MIISPAPACGRILVLCDTVRAALIVLSDKGGTFIMAHALARLVVLGRGQTLSRAAQNSGVDQKTTPE